MGDAAANDDREALGAAHRSAMVRHLPTFALCWLGTQLVWTAVLVLERRLAPLVALLGFGSQAAVLAGAIVFCRARPTARAVPRVLLAACVLIGLFSVALFAAISATGDLLAFILLTLYLASALFFAWGWVWTLGVLAVTSVAWLAAVPALTFHVPSIELVAAIVVGSVLSLGVAERAARGFRFGFLHRVNEERARKAAEASRDAAEAATRAKDEFIADLSHELRSPLNAILTWTHVLRRGMLPPDQAEHALEVVERNARAQVRLIEDLLDVSRIVSGKLHLEMAHVDVRSIVRNVLDAQHGAADAKGIRVELTVAPTPLAVCVDPTRLHQVIDNLLSNAVKFTPEGGHIDVHVARVGDAAEVVVHDTGIGIAPEVLARVFDRFEQGDSSIVRRQRGLGLGLAIARHLVELHGGTIAAESEGMERGSTFRVRLPLDPHAELGTDTAAAEHPSRRLDPLPRLTGLRVIVVDDEPDARDFVSTLLSACGSTVTPAASAAEALRALAERRPDVLVADLAMPEEDGFALIRKIRRLEHGRGPRMRAIALTALAGAEHLERAMTAGFDLHLTKPVEPEDVVAAVAAARVEAAEA